MSVSRWVSVGLDPPARPRRHLRDAVVGSVAAFAVFFVLNLIYPRGMAFGDVRLSAVIGLYLGWLGPRSVFLGLFLAFLSASLIGIGLMVVRRVGRKTSCTFTSDASDPT